MTTAARSGTNWETPLAIKLQKLQNRAARVITRSSYDADAGALLTLLQLENLSTRCKKIKAQLMFKKPKAI